VATFGIASALFALDHALSSVLLHAGVTGKHAASKWLSRVGVACFGLLHVVAAPLLFAFDASQLATTSHAALEAAAKAEIPARQRVQVVGIGLSNPSIALLVWRDGVLRALVPPKIGGHVLVKHEVGPMRI
jgi:hypothetical protein